MAVASAASRRIITSYYTKTKHATAKAPGTSFSSMATASTAARTTTSANTTTTAAAATAAAAAAATAKIRRFAIQKEPTGAATAGFFSAAAPPNAGLHGSSRWRRRNSR